MQRMCDILSACGVRIRNSKVFGSGECWLCGAEGHLWWMGVLFPPTRFSVAWLGCSLHLVAAVGLFSPLPVIRLEHAFPPTGLCFGCSLQIKIIVRSFGSSKNTKLEEPSESLD